MLVTIFAFFMTTYVAGSPEMFIVSLLPYLILIIVDIDYLRKKFRDLNLNIITMNPMSQMNV